MPKGEKKSSELEMTFFEHLDALRPHLVRGVLVMLVLVIVAFACKGFIIDTVLMGPKSPDFPMNKLLAKISETTGVETLATEGSDFSMINTTMFGQFQLHITISVVTALVLSIPYLLWEIWQFVKPALTRRERKGTRMFVFYVSLCFFIGLSFGYFLIAPLTVNFLTNYVASADIVNMIDVGSYLSTVINASLISALMFQLPLLVYFLTRIGILSPAFLRKYRRHAIMILALFAALITPPDLMSLVLVLVPVYALYEFSVNLSARTRRKMDEREAAEEAEFHSRPTAV